MNRSNLIFRLDDGVSISTTFRRIAARNADREIQAYFQHYQLNFTSKVVAMRQRPRN